MPAFFPEPSRAATAGRKTAPIVSPCGRSSAAATLAAGPTFAPFGATRNGVA
jgi:hypothetical protein